MRLSLPLSKASSSSKQWLARQSADPFVRARTTYRSRSSFKLIELARRFPVLPRGGTVVDLGAAPGGWSQVAAERVGPRGRVFALDLLGMDEIAMEKGAAVTVVQGDFLDAAVQADLLARVGVCGIDVVLSDMMAPMSGVRARDVQASLDLIGAATSFAMRTLRPERRVQSSIEDSNISPYDPARAPSGAQGGGSLILKFFLHPDLLAFRKEFLDPCFRKITTDKPKASRPGESPPLRESG